jgi:hypothetical protein
LTFTGYDALLKYHLALFSCDLRAKSNGHIRKRKSMTNSFRAYAILFTALLAVILQIRAAEAFHSGSAAECKECHAGNGAALRGSDESSTCLRCHQAPRGVQRPTGHYVASNYADVRAGMPPLQLTPGGDFGYLKKSYSWTSSGRKSESPGDRHGHNIVAMDFGYSADVKNAVTPGGSYPASKLSCVSCHDAHGKTGGAYRLLGGIGYASRSARGPAFTYGPPVAVAPRDYNRSEALTDTRVAYGQGMSEWCTNCHARIGADAGAANYGHPVGNRAQFTGETISNYHAYVKSGSMNGRGDTSFSSLVPFEEGTDDRILLAQHAKNDGTYTMGPGPGFNVMCLTCHRAHASGWDHMARWNMTADFIVFDGVYPGTENGFAAQRAQGRTAAETRTALYDRPVTLFARHQKGLCNKCHAKD